MQGDEHQPSSTELAKTKPNECRGILVIFVTIFEDGIHQFIPTSKPSKDNLWMNRVIPSYAHEEAQSLETL